MTQLTNVDIVRLNIFGFELETSQLYTNLFTISYIDKKNYLIQIK